MKKILFLLVALLGVVGMANAADGDVVQFDRSLLTLKANALDKTGAVASTTQSVKVWNKANPDATVSYNTGDAKLMSGSSEITGFTISAAVKGADGSFTFDIKQTDATASLPSTFLLTLPERYFKSVKGSVTEYSQVITFKLDWLNWELVGTTPVTIYQFVGENVNTYYEKVNGVAATINTTSVTGLHVSDNNLTLKDVDYRATACGLTDITIPAGTYKEETTGILSPAFKIQYQVVAPKYTIVPYDKKPDTPVTIDYIYNDETALTLRFAKFPVATPAEYEDIESSWVKTIKIGNQTIDASNTTWSVQKKGGIVVYTVTGIKPATIFPNGKDQETFPVTITGTFGANQDDAFACGTLTVKQKVVKNALTLGFASETEDWTKALKVTKCELPATAGGVLKVNKKNYVFADNTIYLTQDLGSTPVTKVFASKFSTEELTFGSDLKSGNTNILVVPADAVYAYGQDYIKYYSKANADQYVAVYHGINIDDNGNDGLVITVAGTPSTIYDNYQCVHYNRNYKGVREAFFAPFSFDAAEFDGTIQKIYAITVDEDVLTFHMKTLKAGDKVLANKPYIVTADGDKSIDIHSHSTMNLTNVEAFTGDKVTCATTETNYEFIGTDNNYYFYDATHAVPASWPSTNGTVEMNKDLTYYAMKDGQLKKIVATNTIVPLRFYMTSTQNPNGVNYSKFAFVDDDEATSINAVDVNVENAPMFNVAGQRISAPVKGQVYIMNGKKYIAK